MRELHALPIVSVRDLVRAPAAVLDRVRQGERFIVCRYGTPVATLQPLDGWVFDPFGGDEMDIYGSPLGNPAREAGKLSDLQRTLIEKANSNGRYIFQGPGSREALEDLVFRGLARKRPEGGTTITGRGVVLQEWLRQRAAGHPLRSSPPRQRTQAHQHPH